MVDGMGYSDEKMEDAGEVTYSERIWRCEGRYVNLDGALLVVKVRMRSAFVGSYVGWRESRDDTILRQW